MASMVAILATLSLASVISTGVQQVAVAAAYHAPPPPSVPRIAHTTVALKGVPTKHNPAPSAPRATKWPASGQADVSLAPPRSQAKATPQRASGAPVAAGSLPITIATAPAAKTTQSPTAATAPDSVHVALTDQDTARKADVTGVMFSLTPTAGDGQVSVGLNYSAFRDAVGADWGTRLRLVTLPSCALTTPTTPVCQVQTPIPSSTNNARSNILSASVRLPSTDSGVVLAATAGSAGSNGTFAASSLKPSETWSVSGASGDFAWNYPITVPPAASGSLAPDISLAYDAQSTDGETAGTNNQVSWIGEGWDYSPGFIERTYRSCSDDTTLPTADQTADLCWAGQVVTMSLNGAGTALVQDDTTHAWRTQADNGDRIENLNGASNGTSSGEYWKVTATDGTQYFFGRNTAPGAPSATNSAWSVPVYGPHAGDPCNNSTGFSASSCLLGWRWNLDYVEDTHGNVTMYYYTPETNYYGADANTTAVSYARGGYLTRIDYGLRDENSKVYANPAPDQVLFTVAERCFPSGTITCDPSQFTAANAASWPDTPQDQQCLSGSLCNNHGPTFWSTKRLSTITTRYYNGTGYSTVDSYALGQEFLTAGDPALWLDSITRTGYAADGSTITMPAVTFTPQLMDNRVAGLNNEPAMSRNRLVDITEETGETIQVTYSQPQCTATNVPAKPSQDAMLCYPVYWALPFQSNQTLDYFHKYVTKQVDVQDPNGLSPTQITTYTYGGTRPGTTTTTNWSNPRTVPTVSSAGSARSMCVPATSRTPTPTRRIR